MKRLLSGNESIALGAFEGGVRFASAYPGTPSTEILENLALYQGIVAEWASNEKVALDNAIGAAFAGARALAAMKHVGVNVAADSLFSLIYTGVRGGLVLVSADDPGTFSSQNEQDNRQYAKFAKFPCLEPSDSQEAKDYTALAFEISEQFDTPVLLRSTTRLSHSKSAVEVQAPTRAELPPLPHFEKNPKKYVIIPAHARELHPVVEARIRRLEEYVETSPLNRIMWGDPHKKLGIVTTGVAYQYAREVFGGCSILKLGISYPIPKQMIRDFAAQVETLVVVEELDPFFEEQIRAMGLKCYGKDIFPLTGEFTTQIVRDAAIKAGLVESPPQSGIRNLESGISIPPRPPALCPGCPHRAAFYALSKHKIVVPGDIGCYSIGVLPPFNAMDTIISMGASIGLAHGMKQVGMPDKLVAVIGDSTFFHTGLPALATVVYNNSPTTIMILDNGTTGMTGQQGNPASGQKLQPTQGARIDIESVVRAMGIKDVWKVPGDDVKAVDQAVKDALAITDRPSVIIVEGKCVFIQGFQRKNVVEVDPEACNGCTLCFRVGCPAVLKSDELDAKTQRPKATIDTLLCTGCDVCLQVCPRHAIIHPEPATVA